MKNIFIAGSTGSVGKSAVEVALLYPEKLSVKAIAAGHFTEELKRQIIKLNPSYCILSLKTEMDNAKSETSGLTGIKTKFLCGEDGFSELISNENLDIILNAISGSSGLMLSYLGLKAGKNLALANKESIVMAGDILNRVAKFNKADIIPVDSEHSALFQCLNCGNKPDLKKLILTASGGPFYDLQNGAFTGVTRDMALNHPKWKMGKKITIDSSTLANKGLEIIEAHYLFDVDEKDIEVLIHPQAVVHSMVEFMDGSVIAQMAQADIKGPIGYALSYPDRFHGLMEPLNFAQIGRLEFLEPDTQKFPFLNLAREALRVGRSMPAVFCEANEFFVKAFLENKISFTGAG
ncbi:MAG: 1-deoxy-D-xylulose-5-phosphate reductoisomerase [Deltaproteobacteria bacterium]|nr:1-deoxy-D-xylulose-5-phosphate reductoisomerase [Deltaproteobacteria bacterium]